MQQAWERLKMHTKFCLANLKGRDHVQDLHIHRWEENIRMDLRETGWEGVDSIHLASGRPV